MICESCNKDKTDNHFYKNKNTDRISKTCKLCYRHRSGTKLAEYKFNLELFENGLKKCGKCQIIKSLIEFSSDKQQKYGYASLCKECKKEKRNKKLTVKDNKKARVRKYGINLETFYKMLINQEHKCDICNTEINESCHIDHDHNTGKVRGLLCSRCNTGLGNFKDNQQFLFNAIEYLEKNN